MDCNVPCYGLCERRGLENNSVLAVLMSLISQVELYINGEKSPQKNKKPIERPEDHAGLDIFYENPLGKNPFCQNIYVLSQETYGCATRPQLLRQDALDWKDS